jgi:hypothetical protein
MLSLSKSDYGSNADDRVIDVLRKLLTKRFSDFVVTFLDELVGSGESGQTRHCLQVPDNDTICHGCKGPSALGHRCGQSHSRAPVVSTLPFFYPPTPWGDEAPIVVSMEWGAMWVLAKVNACRQARIGSTAAIVAKWHGQLLLARIGLSDDTLHLRGEVMRTIGILALVVLCAACAGNETTQLRSKEQRESPARGGQATPGSAKRQAALTDQEISEIIVRTSRQGYYSTGRSCACPDDSARGGSRCGMRSAYSRPGGASPKCYLLDVTTADIAAFRARQLSH